MADTEVMVTMVVTTVVMATMADTEVMVTTVVMVTMVGMAMVVETMAAEDIVMDTVMDVAIIVGITTTMVATMDVDHVHDTDVKNIVLYKQKPHRAVRFLFCYSSSIFSNNIGSSSILSPVIFIISLSTFLNSFWLAW